MYDEVIPLIRAHAKGHVILAGPDSPQIYFLGGFENPTGTMFEMFEDYKGYQERMKQLIDERSVKVVVLNSNATFSESFLDPLRRVALEQFPSARQVETFEVHWRP